MSGTALDRQVVRDYLRELDAAFATLPGQQGRELKEQIRAHLEDTLGPDADDQEAAAVLARLGSPSDLAAEAKLGAAPASAGTRWLRALLARLDWRGRALAVATVLAIVTLTWYFVSVSTAEVPTIGLSEGWWYSHDARRAVMTSADGAQQYTAPMRTGQRQGFFVDINNPSDWTQTVLGFAGGDWQAPGARYAQLELGVRAYAHGWPGNPYTTRFSLPGVIPPHQWRLLRVMWISGGCLPQGAAEGIDQLRLQVRVGWTSRAEVVPLGQGWYLSGPSSPGSCPQ
jgi:hypothetical protein